VAFDYTEGAAEGEVSVRAGPPVLRGRRVHPRVLRDVSTVDTSVEVGRSSALPFGIAPIGSTRMMRRTATARWRCRPGRCRGPETQLRPRAEPWSGRWDSGAFSRQHFLTGQRRLTVESSRKMVRKESRGRQERAVWPCAARPGTTQRLQRPRFSRPVVGPSAWRCYASIPTVKSLTCVPWTHSERAS
jgi:hypothetical protein